MTDFLDLTPKDRVLEVDTGSGYQTAVLASIAMEVFSIETIAPLAEAAAGRLKKPGYSNTYICQGDGTPGWPEEAPFNAIMVTAASPRFPDILAEHLAKGGRMIVPVGQPFQAQTLYHCTKQDDGTLAKKKILPVAFVPMVESHN